MAGQPAGHGGGAERVPHLVWHCCIEATRRFWVVPSRRQEPLMWGTIGGLAAFVWSPSALCSGAGVPFAPNATVPARAIREVRRYPDCDPGDPADLTCLS